MAALREVEILDTPAEQIYDDIVALASAICRTPIAVVNFIDEDRQWGKALVGLASSEAPREASFCARTIVAEDGTFVVPDTAIDPDWSENAMVLGEPNLRFYAGAAIVVDGHALGTVCVADREARDLAPEQLEALRVLSRQTAAALELRMKTKDLEAANSDLRRMAVEDALTGLANRSLLFDRLGVALRQRLRSQRPLGVVFGDLDGFKAVNDRLGHHAGDRLLKIVASRLAVAARGGDTVARIAGDEFVVACPDLSAPDDIEAVAERLEAAVARPAKILGREIVPRISLGWALAENMDDAERLLHRADEAMYAAKRERAGARQRA
jgi:diguanylate cyclase (GGDEF)-like protein